jgi:hypothetical protein
VTRALTALVAATVGVSTLAGCTSDPSEPGSRAPAGSPRHTAPATAHVRPSRVSAPLQAPTVTARVLRWRLPSPRSRAVAVRYGARVLLAGGLGPGDRSTDEVLGLDVGRGSFRRQGHLTEPVHDSAGVVVAGHPMLFGGGGATELDDVQRLGRAGRWEVVGHLPQPRSDLSAVAVGTAGGGSRPGAILVGGYDGARTPTTVLRTGGGSTFTVAGRLPAGVRYAGVAGWGRTVWVVGGEARGRELDDVLAVDVPSGRVRRLHRLPRPLGHEAVAVVAGRLLVMGGRTAPGTVTDRVWWYDPRRDRWSRAGVLPYPVADAAPVSVGRAVLLMGGETPGFTANVVSVHWHH